MADTVGMSRQGLQKALSEKGNPRPDTISSIMKTMGYPPMPQEMDLHAEHRLRPLIEYNRAR